MDARAAALPSAGRIDLLTHGRETHCNPSAGANRLKISAVLEIPTWHRNKGKVKPAVTKSERERDAPFPKWLLNVYSNANQQVIWRNTIAPTILRPLRRGTA